jgi:hypothetical protein
MATIVSFQAIKYNKSDSNLTKRFTLLLINQQFKPECFHKLFQPSLIFGGKTGSLMCSTWVGSDFIHKSIEISEINKTQNQLKAYKRYFVPSLIIANVNQRIVPGTLINFRETFLL